MESQLRREAHKCRTPKNHFRTNWKAIGYLCMCFVISQLLIKKNSEKDELFFTTSYIVEANNKYSHYAHENF